MALSSGTRFGVYDVTTQIGLGGMGEVYRARDTRLGRDVALKVLPAAVAQDPERIARFQREAQVLASLNHPNIAIIYGLEHVGDTHALVMELVTGEDLAQRLSRGPIPFDEAVPLARQIVEALEAAHGQGVVHRDLKPANIKVRPDGTVKVLDFGLAKFSEPRDADGGIDSDPNRSPTITTPAMTAAGIIMGTAAYMSPEQARGRSVDKRSDIWAFGVVLYEMLAGKRAFDGRDTTEVIAAVVKSTPNWTALPDDVPPSIVTLIQRCLEKERKTRISEIAVARFILSESATSIDSATTERIPRRRSSAIVAAVSALAGALLVGAAAWALTRPAASPPERVSVMLPSNRPIAFGPSPGISLAISPDGTHLAYVGTNLDAPPGPGRVSLHLRALGSREVRDLPATADANQPFFSPDGKWIAFFTNGGDLKKIAVGGGNPVTLIERINGGQWGFGAWSDEHTIVFTTPGPLGLRRVSADGGSAETITTFNEAEGETGHNGPDLVPGARAALFTVVFGRKGAYRIDAVILGTGERHLVLENAGAPHYLSSGHLLFQRGGQVMIAPFDAKRLAVTGPSVPLIDEVRRDSPEGDGPMAQLAVSRAGTLAYVPAIDTTKTLGLVSRTGAFEPIALPDTQYGGAAISPTGQYVAYEVSRGLEADVYVYDFARGATIKMTQSGSDSSPAWHPNGRAVTVTSTRTDRSGAGLYLKDLNGSERLLLSSGGTPTPFRNFSWLPDGTALAYTAQNGSQHDIWLATFGEKPATRPLVNGPGAEHSPRFSPDGKWLAYVSDESGRNEVYVRRYPSGDRLAVSTDGGDGPVWRRDGKELFFQGAYNASAGATSPTYGVGKLLAVSVSAEGNTLQFAKPVVLFDLKTKGPTGDSVQYSASDNTGQRWDALPDGQHFVMSRGADPQGAREIVLVQHWFDELRSRLATR